MSTNPKYTYACGADALRQRLARYAAQFFEVPPGIFAEAGDPDQHKRTYEWRDLNGALVAAGRELEIRGLAHGSYTFVVTVRDGRGGTASDTVRVTIVPTTEIVLWAGTGFPQGTFSSVEDSTAAGGVRAIR